MRNQMKQDYYKTPELKHNIVFRENFFEKPKISKLAEFFRTSRKSREEL